MQPDNSVWTEKGATLSNNNATKEYGLTRDEIIEAIKNGKLQYRVNYVHGNPYYKLIRSEVEAVVKEKYGDNYFENQKLKTELTTVKKQLRKYRKQVKLLEKRKAELEIELNEISK